MAECFYLAVPSGSTNFNFARLQKALPDFAASVSAEKCRFEFQGKYVFLQRLNRSPGDLEDESFQLPKGSDLFHIYWCEFNGLTAFDIVMGALLSIDRNILISSDWFSGSIVDHKYS